MFKGFLRLISQPDPKNELEDFLDLDDEEKQKQLLILRRELLYEQNIDFSKNKIKCGLVGIEKIGQSCVFNSLFQCLFNSAPLSKALLTSNQWKKELNPLFVPSQGKIVCQYYKLLKKVWESDQCYICPNTLFSICLKSEKLKPSIKSKD